MAEIEFSDEMGVSLVDSMGTDLTVVNAAKVSLNRSSEALGEHEKGLIEFLMKNSHLSPFEHCVATFKVEVPLFVRSEWHRHRTQSYNEISGRYSILTPKFYIPNAIRPNKQVGKPGNYKFEIGTGTEKISIQLGFEEVYRNSWKTYEDLLSQGIAKEVARDVLPLGLYTSFFATANLRNWLAFLALRTSSDALFEIRHAALKIEQELIKLFPQTLLSWNKYDRPIL